MVQFSIRPLTHAQAIEMCQWRYEPPYDIYNLESPPSEDSLQYLLDPAFAYHGICNGQGSMVGFCTFGEDAQVPGGDYGADALDVGMGVRPDLTGQGLGLHFATAVVEFATKEYAPYALRVTIAQFNQRAQRVWQKLAFCERARFGRTKDNMPFVILIRSN